LTIPLARRRLDVAGTDISEEMVDETRKKLKKENLIAEIFTAI
jgi:2-polyprenyl-3-methyl-5-hydroxy-6-metoxy-1,4-benzoquinol methylase